MRFNLKSRAPRFKAEYKDLNVRYTMSGRKRTKKLDLENDSVADTGVAATTATSEPVVDSESKKTRARKTTSKKTPPVVAVVSPAGISGSFLSEQRPLIAHIPVTTAQVTFENIANDENSSETIIKTDVHPYDIGTESIAYLDGVNNDESVGYNTIQENPITSFQEHMNKDPVFKSKLPNHYSEKLMMLFQDSNRNKTLPTKTDIACFWCCHSFQTPPCAIPSHVLDEVWYMYGNFCSPECATAYLMKEKIDSHVQWERYALLNTLYSSDVELPVGAPHGIRPAPSREVLRMFGGSMDISEYRAVIHEKKLRIDVLTPPMVSIIQTMDTKPIDFYDQNLKNVFIKNDLQHKYNAPGAQGLRLRRTKPVKSREATVEWAMKIQTLE